MRLLSIETAPKDGTRVMLWVNDDVHNWVAWEGCAEFQEAYLAFAAVPPVMEPAGWFWPDFELYNGITLTATHWSELPYVVQK